MKVRGWKVIIKGVAPASSFRASPTASARRPPNAEMASCRSSMFTMRPSGRHSHCRRRRRPKGVAQLSSTDRSVPG